MKEFKDTISDLHQMIEAHFSEDGDDYTSPRLTKDDVLRLLHELHVHQIELELLNDELVAAKTQLEAEREKYTNLYDYAPTGYFSFDENGIIQEVNLNGADLLGRERSFLIGKPFKTFIGSEAQNGFSLFLQKVFATEEKCYCELTLHQEDGCPRYIQIEGSKPDGEDHCFAVVVDITERKTAQINILNTVVDAVIWLDKDRHILFFNHGATKIFGYSQTEALKMTLEQLIPKRFRDKHPQHFYSFLEGPLSVSLLEERSEIIGLRKNGEEFPLEASLSKIVEHEQSIAMIVLRDISKRVNTEKLLLENERRYRGLVESQIDLIVRIDPQGKFTFVNQAYCEKFGKKPEELLGQHFQPLVYADDLTDTMDSINGITSPPYRVSHEQRAYTVDGLRWLVWQDAAIHDQNGNLIEIQGIGRDITESKQDRMLLEARRDLAQELAGTSSLQDALALCLKKVIQVSGMDCGGIYLVNRITKNLDLMITEGLSEEFEASAAHYSVDSPNWKVVMAGKPIYAPYQEFITKEIKNIPSVREREGLRAMAVVPITHQGQVVACFNLSSHSENDLTEFGRSAAEEIALQIGSAITRVQAEEDLRSSQRGLVSLFNSIQDYIFVLDENGNVIKINQQVTDHLGYTEEELVGISVLEVHPPDCREAALNIVQEMLAGREDTCMLSLLSKNGERIPVETKVTQGNWDGRPVLIGVSRDFTERLLAEEKMNYRSYFEDLLTRISTNFINLTSEEIDTGVNAALKKIGEFEEVDRTYVFILDEQKKTMNNTHEWCAAGIEPQIDVLQDLPWDLLPWWMDKLVKNEVIDVNRVADMPDIASAEKDILQAQDIKSVLVLPLTFNKRLIGFAGFDAVRDEHEWTLDNIAMLTMFSNILSNALERKRVEDVLRNNNRRISAILNAMPDLMFRISAEGCLLDYAASNTSELVVDPDQIIGSHISTAIGEENTQKALQLIKKAIATGEKATMEYEIKTPDGTQHFEARFVSSGENEVIAVVRNMSERVRLEQMKSDFINRATHDLRTPLTTILLMLRLLEGDCTPEEQKEYWVVLKEEVERERQLIEDLLMVGRLESGRWHAKLTPLSPLPALHLAIQTIAPQAEDKDIHLEISIPNEEFQVMGDPSALQQVFANLLSNAVKFTPVGGQVNIQVQKVDGSIRFTVKDNGMGIAPEDMPNLFMRFFRGGNAIENEVPGSGIGLFIIKSIIEHFGGSIQATSELNIGTTFVFSLPLLPFAEAERR